jgi:hypothetical protein
MQIQPVAMKEFMNEATDENELNRDSFLTKLSILTVSYFCMSTEMRFLLQSRAMYLKPEVKRERELESEYWHAKALEISCTFLPSECPLLNHVLLSYQKHHDPSNQPIKEDEESSDLLSVLRPLKGIEQSKYQPIIRLLPDVKVNLPLEKEEILCPLKDLLKEHEDELCQRVAAGNPKKLRIIAELTDKEIQVEVGEAYMVDQSQDFDKLQRIQKTNKSEVMNQNNILDDDDDNSIEKEIMNVDANANESSNIMLPFSLNQTHADGIGNNLSANNSESASMRILKE